MLDSTCIDEQQQIFINKVFIIDNYNVYINSLNMDSPRIDKVSS